MNSNRNTIFALLALALFALSACDTETGPDFDSVSVEPVAPASLESGDQASTDNFGEDTYEESVPQNRDEALEMLSSLAGGNGASGAMFSLRQSTNGESPAGWLEDNDDFEFNEIEGQDFYEVSIFGESSEDDYELTEFEGFSGGTADFYLDLDIFLRQEFPSDTEFNIESANSVYGRIDINNGEGEAFDHLAGRIAAAVNVNFAESMRFDEDSFELIHASTAYSISSEFSVALSIESGEDKGHFLLTVDYDHDFAVSASSFQEYSTALQDAFGDGEYTISLAVYSDPNGTPEFEEEVTVDDLGDFGAQMTAAIVGSHTESMRARR